MLINSTWTLEIREETLLPCGYSPSLIKLLYQKMGLEFTTGLAIPEVTFSGILGEYKKYHDFYLLLPDKEYSLSLSGLEINSGQAIAELELNDSLDFLGASFQIVKREDNITTYEQLYTQLVAQDPQAVKDYRLKFFTPTSFAQGKMNLGLPIPSLMFRSWLSRWNNFCNIYLGSDELTHYLSQNIYLNYYYLRSRKFHVERDKITGFVGDINLKIPYRVDDLLANVANLLINYSQYCGTGIKTRLGMGYTSIRHQSISEYKVEEKEF